MAIDSFVGPASRARRVISLLSDTETCPTPEMREAIARAEVGDEQRREDPTVNLLQERVAELLGKEAALWFPTGTLCNVVAVKLHTSPADVIIAEGMSHIVRAEAGGAALVSGVMVEPIVTSRGIFSGEELRQALARVGTLTSHHAPRARLICVEQTHNFGGGTVWSLEELTEVARIADEMEIPVHMDGARLLNAAVALDLPPARLAGTADSVWIDFAKGLGAPMGAVLAGTRRTIEEAWRYKQMFGGAMRQAGIAAAACLYALDHHIPRLALDHANARRLAEGLGEIPGIEVRTPNPETNMVFFRLAPELLEKGEGETDRFLSRLAGRGIRIGTLSRGEMRAVTHLDVSAPQIDEVLEVMTELVASE